MENSIQQAERIRYKASAKRAARIDDGTKHELFSNLPEFPPKL